ncbi:MAG: hypothetical protein ACR2QA_14235 [Solirubrobacteraceae bacterium]
MTVLTRHKPSHARIQLRRLSGPRIGSLAVCAAVLGMLAIAPEAAAAAAGVNITAVEGQSFTGNVVNGLVCPLSSATISWGDGTTSAGTSDRSTGIQGTHTYAEEGTYAGSVSFLYQQPAQFRCLSGTQSASFQATVQDASLTGAGRDISGTAGQPLSAVVVHVDDANPGGIVADFSVRIDWGDGSSSAGTVAAGTGGGGFDVTGAHTYSTVGAYTTTTTIVDIGGAATTVSSNVHITVATPPPPPPPPPPLPLPLPHPPVPPLVLPQARFGFAPFSPCQNDNVSFDASSSTGGGGGPITKYHWSIDESAFAPTQFTSTKPTLAHVFPASSYSVGPYRGPLPNKDLNDYHFFRPPVTVTLQVTDNAGNTASSSRTITFVDPDELLVGLWETNRKTGLPFLYLFRDSRFADVVPCQPRSLDPRSTIVNLARPRLPAIATLRQSGAGAAYRVSIAVRSPCRSGLVQCSGELIVSQGPSARGRTHIPGNPGRGALARSLGHATFFVLAGRSATVIVRLNARGRALARAHKLGRVTLSLLTSGPKGGIAISSRTIIIVSGRAGRT